MAHNKELGIFIVKVTKSQLPSFPPGTKIEPSMIEKNNIEVVVFTKQTECQKTDFPSIIEFDENYVFRAETDAPQTIEI